MRLTLKDLLPNQTYAASFRSVGPDETYSEWTQVQRFVTAGDLISPAAVTGLNWRPSADSFVATWTPVTTNSDGTTMLDFQDYKITISNGVLTKTYYQVSPTFELTLAQNKEVFTTIAQTVSITVQARDRALNLGAVATASATMDIPPVPSTPILTVYMGTILVTWDGNPATGLRNDTSLNHVEIHASTTNNFTATDSTRVGRFDGVFPGPQTQSITGFAYGTVVYVKLVAVNRYGIKSAASAQASATPSRITGLDIANGQISAAQINFTAFDIGGANAYYPATIAARDALTNVKSGDIAYITGSGYATYRYNGTTWVAAPEIGVIQGSKIIAGTVTSNAVGTNLLITSSANIGTAVIDSANIASINAAKITAGLLQSSSMVTYGGGTSRPAWSFDLGGIGQLSDLNVRGQLVIGNSTDTTGVRAASLVRSYDYLPNTAGWAIKGDGTVEFNNGVFRGSIAGSTIVGSLYQTATTGRRIEIGAAGSSGEVSFYAPNGAKGVVRSTSAPTGGEFIQMQMPIAGAQTIWNAVTASVDTSGLEAVYIASQSVQVFVGPSVSSGYFVIYYTSNKSTLATPFSLYSAGSNGNFFTIPATTGLFDVSDQDNNTRLQISNTGAAFYNPSGKSFAVVERSATTADLYYRFNISSTDAWFQWPTAMGGAIGFRANPISDANFRSAKLVFSTDNNGSGGVYEGILKFIVRTGGINPAFQFRSGADDAYYPVECSTLTQSSSRAGKEQIETLPAGALDKVRAMRVTKFRRKGTGGTVSTVDEIGVIAEEVAVAAPDIVRVDGTMVDLGSWVGLLTAAMQESNQKTDDKYGILEERIKQIETMIKDMRDKK